MSRRIPSTLAAILIFAVLIVVPASAKISMVYSVQRHGARNQLPKTALLQESESLGGPTLLPQGQRMCFNAGTNFRQRYIDFATCGATCLAPNTTVDTEYGLYNFGHGYHNYNTRVRASYTDRAILSAQAFFAGIFPANVSAVNDTWGIPTGQQMVPVYTTVEQDDWLIRAYTKCDTYNKNLINWYASDAFQAKAAETASLRATVKQYCPTLDTNLTNWWNVYDAINTWRTYGVGEPQPPLGQPQIDDATWNATVALAYWLETSKMKSDLTRNLLGGPLVADMLQYMQTAITDVQTGKSVYYKLLSISSHYNVQLGILSALQLDKYPPAVAALNWLTATLPQLASVVVFELHTDALAGSVAVRLVVQPGPGKAYIVVPMSCAAPNDPAEQLAGAGACTWDAFNKLASPVGLATANAWCSACANTNAASCALAAANSQLTAAQAQLAATSGSNEDTVSQSQFNTAVAAGVVVTFFGTLLICAALFGVLYMRSKRRWQHQAGEQPGNLAPKPSSDQI